MPGSFDGSVGYGQGQIQRGKMRGIILPPAIFKNVFHVAHTVFS